MRVSMKIIKSLLLLFTITTSTAFAEVGKKDLDEIRELTRNGLYQKALEKHLWFHEESKSSSGMGGVRLSFAINAWIELGNKYPPALDALISVRDKNKELLLSGEGSFNNFLDLFSINRELEDENDTYDVFLFLDKKFPSQAENYYHVAEDLLIKRKKYDICGKYIGDPIYKYENMRHMRELQISFMKEDAKMDSPSFRQHTDQTFVSDVLKLIEVLVAIEKMDDAREIQRRAMSYYENDKIRYALHN